MSQQDQESVRQKLNNYINKYGSKNTFIARKIGVSESVVRHFKTGRRNINESNLQKLEKFLNELR